IRRTRRVLEHHHGSSGLEVQQSRGGVDPDADVAGVGVENVVSADGPWAAAAGAGQGVERVRRGGHGLARAGGGEIAGAGGTADGDLEPALAAVEGTGAEVQ